MSRTGIEISVQCFDEEVDLFQDNEFVQSVWNSHYKVQRCVASIHEFEGALFNDVAHFGSSGQYVAGNVAQNASFVRF